MIKVGIWMMIFGVGSFVLNMAGMEFKILMWIDTWGTATGNLIRGGFVAAGLALVGIHLFLLSRATAD